VRLNKLYFGMLQISLGSLIWIVALRWYSLTGGDDGIHGIRMPEVLSSTVNAYYFLLAVVSACILIMFLIYKSPFGVTLRAIRDNPQRCEAVGIDVRRHQLLAIVIATFFAGVAGVMFVVLRGPFFRTCSSGFCRWRFSSCASSVDGSPSSGPWSERLSWWH